MFDDSSPTGTAGAPLQSPDASKLVYSAEEQSMLGPPKEDVAIIRYNKRAGMN